MKSQHSALKTSGIPTTPRTPTTGHDPALRLHHRPNHHAGRQPRAGRRCRTRPKNPLHRRRRNHRPRRPILLRRHDPKIRPGRHDRPHRHHPLQHHRIEFLRWSPYPLRNHGLAHIHLRQPRRRNLRPVRRWHRHRHHPHRRRRCRFTNTSKLCRGADRRHKTGNLLEGTNRLANPRAHHGDAKPQSSDNVQLNNPDITVTPAQAGLSPAGD